MSRRPYVSTYFSPNRGSAATIEGFIRNTQSTLDIAIYALTHESIGKAVVAAHKRGVAVRLLVDKVQAAGRYSIVARMMVEGVPTRLDHQSGSMHHKMAISDALLPSRAVALGSFNWTKNADERNAESLVIVRLRAVTSACTKEYEQLWEANSP